MPSKGQMAKFLIPSLVSFFLTLAFLFINSKSDILNCFPYLETVFKLQKEYTKKLVNLQGNSNVVKELDRRLGELNWKIKTHKGFLIDCSFCLGCKKERLQ